MKILIALLGFAPMGGFRVLTKFAEEWLESGHQVSFLVPQTSRQPYYPTHARILSTDRKGNVVEDIVNIEGKKASGLDNIVSIYFGLNSIGKEYDIIIVDNSLIALPLRLSRCGSAIKVFYTQSDEIVTKNFINNPIKNIIARISINLNMIYITNSNIYPNGSRHLEKNVVYPGIDLGNFYMKEGKFDPGRERIVVGTVGRKEPHKGTPLVLKAFEEIYRRDDRFRLKVALGNLPEGWSHPAAEIVDIQNDADLADFYRSIDVLLVGGVGQHGAPHYPIIEAMACGTPVVHTDYFPGTLENSWVVAPGSPDALVDGVFSLMADDRVAEKVLAGRKFVEGHLTWRTVASTMLSYIQPHLRR